MVPNKFIPFDKSWAIRCIFLDIISEEGTLHTNDFTWKEPLSDDILQAWKAIDDIYNSEPEIDVGESATLYRFLQYYKWIFGYDFELVCRNTLLKRKLETNRDNVLNQPIENLLKLDGGTSQWASAAFLCGALPIHNLDLSKTPYKFNLSIQAYAHWKQRLAEAGTWKARKDPTIQAQAEVFDSAMKGTNMRPDWEPVQPEDYCLARAFSYMKAQEGLLRWPQLQNHESNRIVEMEKAIKSVMEEKQVVSDDHRVVQAAAMLAKVINKNKVTFSNENCVKKSWPQFWDFLKSYDKLKD